MARPYGLPAVAALSLLLFVGLLIPPASGAAAVSWSPSSDLLISEVQTGGASASDEFVELYNAAAVPVDLAGLEIAYSSASGTTVSRKASWPTSLLIEPGGHVLVANGGGAYAGIADTTYSGGFAATGGALVLRVTGGSTIDALAWGDAANAFVEGLAAPAPGAGQSLERRPGGASGGGLDSNDNSADFIVRDSPDPQGLAAPPIPWPGASPSTTPTSTEPSAEPSSPSSPTPTPTAEPTPTPSPTPTLQATPPPTAEPTSTASPTAEPTPTSEPSATPSPTEVVTPSPAPEPTPSPAPTASPAAISIAEARSLAEGTRVRLSGVLTTPLGLIESGHGAFVQDTSGGIGLYLAAADWPTLGAGTTILVDGSITVRYSQVTVRLDRADDLIALGQASQPTPVAFGTGGVDEAAEGLLVEVEGTVTAGPDTLSDGFAVTLDDGGGPLRVVVATASAISSDTFERQGRYRLTGVVGQRDSSGTGVAGYRLYLRSPADVTPLASPSPSPSPAPSPTPGATSTAAPTASPSPTAAPTASPAPSGGPMSISQARALPLGTTVVVRGVVTAEVGRVVDDKSLAIQDASGGIVVRLDGQGRNLTLRRGTWVEVRGTLGQRHDDLELTTPDGAVPATLGTAALPAPVDIDAAGLGEAREGRLVRLAGLVAERTASGNGTLTVILEDVTGRARIVLLPAVGARLSDVARGARLQVTGVVGQYSSARGRPDGYRIWARDLGDLLVLSAPPDGADSGSTAALHPGKGAGRGGGSGSGRGGSAVAGNVAASSGPADVALGDLEARLGQLVRVSGRVDALRADALTLADASGQAEVLLGDGLADVAATLRIGDLVNVIGTVRRGPDDDPVVEPRGPGDVVAAAALGDPARGGAAGGQAGVAAEPSGGAATGSASPLRPSGLPVGQVAMILALVLAGGSALTLAIGRRDIEHLFRGRLRTRPRGWPAGAAAVAPVGPSEGPPSGLG